MVSHSICNNCGEFYTTIYTDSPDDTMTLPDQKSSSTGISAKNKLDRRSYRYQCPACGAVKPKVSYNEENELTYRAFQLLAESKFEEATAAFDAVLAKYPENVEAYWGKVKAKYRVLYKKNAKEKMLPTCEKTKHGSVFKDEHYQKAFQYADERIRKFLKKQANTIDRIRGIKAKKAAVVALASCMIIGAGSFTAYQIFRHRHTLVTEPGIMPTCTETGMAGKTYCSDCGDVLQSSKPIDALGHTPITDADIAPTCTETGMAGKTYCSDCGEVLQNSKPIDALGHTFEWVIVTPPTTTEEGLRVSKCTACGTESVTEAIPAIGSEGLAYTVNADKSTCTITGIGTCKDTELYILAMIDGYRVTSIDWGAFSGCKNLTSIELPDGVTSIGDYAFYNCTSLTSIVIPNGVTSIGDSAFRDCTSLESIELPEGVTSIGNYAFYNCKSLTSIALPDSVTSIGDSAFRYCTSLTSIVIPDSVTSIGDLAFSGCTKLTEIAVSDGNPYYCATDGVLFNKNGTELICYPAGKTESTYTIPYGVTSIGIWAFYDCRSLTSIVIPDSVTSIGNYAFYGCTSLTSIVIPDSVTSIGNYAFYNCTRLKSIKLPDFLTSIGNYSFRDCKNLTSIVIPDSVTSIGDWAFYNCTSLTSIVIPDSVTSIGDSAFQTCTKLTEIRYNGTMAQWQKISKGTDWNTYAGNYKVICTDGTIAKDGTITPN